jgi:galactokinase
MKPETLKKELKNGKAIRETFGTLYGPDNVENQINRYLKLCDMYHNHYQHPHEELSIFSTPGRTEIGGNHTDHNHGRVIASSIHLDTIALAGRRNDHIMSVRSEGFQDEFIIDCNDLTSRAEEAHTTKALIRGITHGFISHGYSIGGFNAYVKSDIGKGSGLSSSASFEILVASILNAFYNKGNVPLLELAIIGQDAENEYFRKPCGLMDQIACAYGGIVTIDFKDPLKPIIETIDFQFSDHDYCLAVVDTGGSHADLTGEYASIPGEMKAVAHALGKTVLRDIDSENNILDHIRMLCQTVSDRAVLRALHFIRENERVAKQADALKKGNLPDFLDMVRTSGDSSFKWLQNCYVSSQSGKQPIPLALLCTEIFLREAGEGACRVHGGGFEGTILVFLPKKSLAGYIHFMQRIFKAQKVTELRIREPGTLRVI